MSYDDLFQEKIEFWGEVAGDTFDVYRPDYTIVDNTPQLIYQGMGYRMDPSTAAFAEPKLRDIDWLEIFGDRTILIPGDILIHSDSDYGQAAPITFAHSMPIKAGIGFRSSRIGNITNQSDNPIYTNVYFEFIGTGYPGSSVNKKLEKSLQIPSARVILFKRDGIFRLRTQLVETDSNNTVSKDGGSPIQYQRKWLVEEIDIAGNFMILTLSQNVKE